MISRIFISRLSTSARFSQTQWVIWCSSECCKQHLVRHTTTCFFSYFMDERGYEHFLNFSQRLTAYVAKVFAMAHSLVLIESSVICDAVRFLIDETQNLDGSFREVGRVYSSGMNVRKDSTDVGSDWYYVTSESCPDTCRVMWGEKMQMPPWQPSASLPCRSHAHYVRPPSMWVSDNEKSLTNLGILMLWKRT